jgi:hypothetical protein
MYLCHSAFDVWDAFQSLDWQITFITVSVRASFRSNNRSGMKVPPLNAPFVSAGVLTPDYPFSVDFFVSVLSDTRARSF